MFSSTAFLMACGARAGGEVDSGPERVPAGGHVCAGVPLRRHLWRAQFWAHGRALCALHIGVQQLCPHAAV